MISYFLSALEGSLGALLMAGAGMLAIISLPIAIIFCVVPLLTRSKKGVGYYLVCMGTPFAFVCIAVGLFIVRALIGAFFQTPV